MKRIPMVLAVTAGVITALTGSALAAAVRTAASPPVNSAPPTVSGTARDGQTLTAANGTWGGATPISYAYQWQLCNSAGSSCGSISKATDQNYVVSDSDVGKTIRVGVTATNADGTSQALSAASAQIAGTGNAPASTKQPNPSGTPQDGLTVTVNQGSWSGDKPITFGYQWQSCTVLNTVCADITGATGSSYVIATGQVGSLLRATVIATNAIGKTSAPSNLTTVVVAKLAAPVSASLPVISGSASVGQTLQASTGTWTGATPTGFTFQWNRCNSDGTSCSGISGATGQSYGVGQADLGMAVKVTVNATNATGSTSVTSTATQITRVVAPLPVRFTAVLRTGQELRHPLRTTTASAGSFSARLTGNTLRWTLTFSHLTGRPTVAHLNKGVRGTNGMAFKTLCSRCASPARGTVMLTASQRNAMRSGGTYVNVLTVRNPFGEIRGQILRVN
jgi:hypothetical protein